MTDLKRQMTEDRAIRESARSIATAQFEHVRKGLSGQRIGEKLADKVGDDTLDAIESAANAAKKNGGVIVALAGLVAAAFAWKPISTFFRSRGKTEEAAGDALSDPEAEAIEEIRDDA